MTSEEIVGKQRRYLAAATKTTSSNRNGSLQSWAARFSILPHLLENVAEHLVVGRRRSLGHIQLPGREGDHAPTGPNEHERRFEHDNTGDVSTTKNTEKYTHIHTHAHTAHKQEAGS